MILKEKILITAQNQNEYDMIFKLFLIDDSSVGKTNIISKYFSN